jgi:hypothetical protein
MSHSTATVAGMPRNPKVAVFAVRMAPALKEGLRDAADAAGCSMNAYFVQVLAAAAGHRARFRGTAETGPTPDEHLDELRELPRDGRGFPIAFKARDKHRWARNAWFETMAERLGAAAAGEVARYCDANCPWFFVEWEQLKGPEWPEGLPQPADRECADRPDAA